MIQPTFTLKSYTVAKLLQRLATDEKTPENPIFIPSLQREFCWDHKQIEALFDSLLRNLPLGSLLLWRVTDDKGREEALYRFIQHYVGESAYPSEKKHDSDGLWVLNKSRKAAPDGSDLSESYSLALDGQQRLTSFLIGLTGTHYLHKRQKWKRKQSSYTRRQLHLDLLAHPDRKVKEDDLQYRFQFRQNGENRTETGSYWWPIKKLPTAGIDQLASDLKEKLSQDSKEAEAIASNLKTLHQAVFERKHLVVEGLTDLTSRVAVDLFVRRNDGGEQLSNADIAFSQIAVYWNLDAEDPKEAIEGYVSRLDNRFADYGFGFDKSFVIRALLMLGGDGPTLRRENLTPGTIRDLEPHWISIRQRDDVGEAYRIVTEELELGDKCIASYKAVLPILYFCYQHRQVYGDKVKVEDPDILGKMEYWLATVTCNQLLTRLNSNRLLKDFCRRIDEDTFPVIELLADYDEPDLPTKLDAERLNNLVRDTHFNSGARKHLLLTKLYEGDRISGKLVEEEEAGTQWQVDHIFPKKCLEEDNLRLKRSLDPETVEDCLRYKNQLANLQLISENQAKKDKDPGDWLIEQAEAHTGVNTLIERHRLPEWNPQEYNDYSRFPEFCRKREALMQQHLRGVIPLHEDFATDT